MCISAPLSTAECDHSNLSLIIRGVRGTLGVGLWIECNPGILALDTWLACGT